MKKILLVLSLMVATLVANNIEFGFGKTYGNTKGYYLDGTKSQKGFNGYVDYYFNKDSGVEIGFNKFENVKLCNCKSKDIDVYNISYLHSYNKILTSFIGLNYDENEYLYKEKFGLVLGIKANLYKYKGVGLQYKIVWDSDLTRLDRVSTTQGLFLTYNLEVK